MSLLIMWPLATALAAIADGIEWLIKLPEREEARYRAEFPLLYTERKKA